MSWKETCPVKERMRFIVAYEENERDFSEICRVFGISRKTGYKWIKRFDEEGVSGLEDRSRAPHEPSNKMCESLSSMILMTKCDNMNWGPRKIIVWLSQEYPDIKWPAASSAGELLKRNGLVKPRKKRRRFTPYTQPFADCSGPNDTWSIDYKGQYRLQNGKYCYPLTLTDNFSRYLLACDAHDRISGLQAKQVMEQVFKEHGLPAVIRSDNGPPFAGRGLGALSSLSVWWQKLGITHERIRPGHPEENGRHERMHRTLKEKIIESPCEDLLRQRVEFKAFLHSYNYERPHEGIGNQRPGWVYEESHRLYPCYLEEIEYGREYETRRIRTNGTMKWNGSEIYISEPLIGEQIGLLQTSDQEWLIYFSSLKLGIFNEATMKVRPIV